ncbi:DUF418 domain-containing protein [Roseobacteraceae bacterium S113]
MPDCLRLIALFGIVVVNVQYMGLPVEAGFLGVQDMSGLDRAGVWLVEGLATLKTFGLFSFMFGVGLGFLMTSAARRGTAFAPHYRRRMFALMGLGVAHGVLFFPGDILFLYGVLGMILMAWRDWPVRRLARLGAVLLVVQALVGAVLVSLPAEAAADVAAIEREVFTQGRWRDVVMFRAISFGVVLTILLPLQGIGALGWFCLGLAAVRAGVLDAPDHGLWTRARRICLVPGVGVSLLGAWGQVYGDAVWGGVLIMLAAPVASLGYLGLIAGLAARPGAVLSRLLPAGAMSLSLYLGQSIVLSTLFAPYGFGLWDQLSPLALIGLGIGVTFALIGALLVWRRRFAQGPFEWLLRRMVGAPA